MSTPPSGTKPLSQNHGFVSQAWEGMSAVSHSRHVGCVTQQTCPLCHTSDMSAVSRHTADMSAVSHSRHVCVSPSTPVCGVTQQTCLLHDTASMFAASHSRCVFGVAELNLPTKSFFVVRALTNSQVLDPLKVFHCQEFQIAPRNACKGLDKT